jgi:hypothetical protein
VDGELVDAVERDLQSGCDIREIRGEPPSRSSRPGPPGRSCFGESALARPAGHCIRRRLGDLEYAANPSPPSGWIEDFHLQANDHARHTRKTPPGGGVFPIQDDRGIGGIGGRPLGLSWPMQGGFNSLSIINHLCACRSSVLMNQCCAQHHNLRWSAYHSKSVEGRSNNCASTRGRRPPVKSKDEDHARSTLHRAG